MWWKVLNESKEYKIIPGHKKCIICSPTGKLNCIEISSLEFTL